MQVQNVDYGGVNYEIVDDADFPPIIRSSSRTFVGKGDVAKKANQKMSLTKQTSVDQVQKSQRADPKYASPETRNRAGL